MTVFNYKLRKADGDIHASRVEADSLMEAVNLIKKEGEILLEINPGSFNTSFSFLKFKASMNAFERINFTDHLASLIGAGTPIKEALEVYVDDASRKSEMIDSIIKDIEQGKKLSVAFSAYPDVFSPLYISLLKAGEVTGNLDETLEYLANELRREYEFIQKVKSAMFYPMLVLSVAFGVISLIVVYVIPKIIQITQNITGDIPSTTKLVISISQFLSKYGILIIALFIGLFLTFILTLRIKKTKEVLAAKILDLPFIGNIMKKYILARFTRVIASSVKYGLPLTTAFDSVQDIVGNIRYREATIRINQRIERGISLSDAISGEGTFLFPTIISRTIKGAEKTGGLDKALIRLSTQYELELDRDLKRVIDMIEPLLVVVLGIIVLGIAISVITPIYQITSSIK